MIKLVHVLFQLLHKVLIHPLKLPVDLPSFLNDLAFKFVEQLQSLFDVTGYFPLMICLLSVLVMSSLPPKLFVTVLSC